MRRSPRNASAASPSSAPARCRPKPLVLAPSLNYLPRSVPEDDADAPLRGLHGEMRTAEGELARAHACRGRPHCHRRRAAQHRRVHARARRGVREAAVQALPAAGAAAGVATAAARHPHAGVPHRLHRTLLALLVVPAHRPAPADRVGLHRPGAPRGVAVGGSRARRFAWPTSPARCCRASCRRARATRARRRTWCRSAPSNSTCVAASATPA